jgi:hypothetical protein
MTTLPYRVPAELPTDTPLMLAALLGPPRRTPYEHDSEDVAAGRLTYTCKPPGWWSRLWNGVPVGAIWVCGCGGKWEFHGWPTDWRKK